MSPAGSLCGAGGIRYATVVRRALLLVLLNAAVFSAANLWPVPPSSAAVTGPAIGGLRVDLWPEHDDPRVLVIYRGTLSGSTPLPYTLGFSIPAGSQVNATAYRRGTNLLSVQHQVQPGTDRTTVAFTVPEREFQFEYYADVITGHPGRSFAMDLVFPLLVESLDVAVEQPLRATGVALNPAPASTTVAGGFTYHLYVQRQWPAGKVWRVRVSYRKDDLEPSLPRAAPAAPAPGAAVLPSGSGRLIWFIAAAAGFILGALFVGAIWLVRRDRARGPSRTPHCPNCGTVVRPQDRFCRRCGHAQPRRHRGD